MLTLDPFGVGEGLLEQGDRLVDLAGGLVRAGEIVTRRQRVEVVGSQDTFTVGNGLDTDSDRPGQALGIDQMIDGPKSGAHSTFTEAIRGCPRVRSTSISAVQNRSRPTDQISR